MNHHVLQLKLREIETKSYKAWQEISDLSAIDSNYDPLYIAMEKAHLAAIEAREELTILVKGSLKPQNKNIDLHKLD